MVVKLSNNLCLNIWGNSEYFKFMNKTKHSKYGITINKNWKSLTYTDESADGGTWMQFMS